MAIVLFTILVFTIIIYILYSKKFLRTELFVDEDYNYDEVYLKEWYRKYRHPMEDIYNAVSQQDNRAYFNTEEIELRSKEEIKDLEQNRHRIDTY